MPIPTKIAFIVCYKYPDYVRSEVLLKALKSSIRNRPGDEIQLVIIKNKHLGLLRYFEVGLHMIQLRFISKPDVYFINFRGYEVLLVASLLRVKKPIVFDEFINFTEWMVEHNKIVQGKVTFRTFARFNRWLSSHAAIILADTPEHAAYSSSLNQIPLSRYVSIPVSADESVFDPCSTPLESDKNEDFEVFYYGHMLPLHGLKYVLEAAVILGTQPGISFTIVGGGTDVAGLCGAANEGGAHITYHSWLPVRELAQAAKKSSVTLGGPFGGTLQSRYVTTGKTYQFLALLKPVVVGKNLVNGVFEDKENSLVVEQKDSRGIADAIFWASENPDQLNLIARRGHKLYLDKFSNKQITTEVTKLLDRLLKNPV